MPTQLELSEQSGGATQHLEVAGHALGAAVFPLRDEAGALEHGHVLLNRGKRHVVPRGELTDGRVGVHDPRQNVAARGIGQCTEQLIEGLCRGLLAYNHLVVDISTIDPASRRFSRRRGQWPSSSISDGSVDIAAPPASRRAILPALANSMCRTGERRSFPVKGHTFGLDLSDEERRALIAFLRTRWRPRLTPCQADADRGHAADGVRALIRRLRARGSRGRRCARLPSLALSPANVCAAVRGGDRGFRRNPSMVPDAVAGVLDRNTVADRLCRLARAKRAPIDKARRVRTT